MSDNESPPILVNATPTKDMATAAVRAIVLTLSVATALAGFVGKRDLAGFIVYVQSSEFLAFMAALIAASTFAWGQWKARHRAKQLATVAADPRVPDAVAALKGPTQ